MIALRPSSKSPGLRHRTLLTKTLLIVMALIGWQPCPVAAQDRDQEHFFETHVRPVLVEKCVGCHGEQKQSGGLRLDSRDAMLKGGESGAALIPGDVSGQPHDSGDSLRRRPADASGQRIAGCRETRSDSMGAIGCCLAAERGTLEVATR